MGAQKRWVTAVVVALVVIGSMQAAQIRPSVARGQSGSDVSDAPYIYYYSNDLNAWVIERADGTDRRLLGQGLMPEETNSATGYGWSPSGKWFTWSSSVTTQSGPPYNPTIETLSIQHLVADTTGKVRFLERNGVWPPPSWSSTEDLLVVEEAKDYQKFPKLFARLLPSKLRYVRYAVEDVEANNKEIVFEREFDEWASYSSAEWLKDGQSILFSYQRSIGSRSDVTFVLRAKNGELTFYRTVADNYTVLPKGVIAHQHNRTLILTDLVHQQNRTIHLDIPDNLHLGMYWNQTGNGVFITGQGPTDMLKSIWWLDVNLSQLHFIGHLITQSQQAHYGLTFQAISPTGRYFAYLDESYQVNYFDSATGQLVRLEIELDQLNYFHDPQFYWTGDDHLIVFAINEKPYNTIESHQVDLINAATGEVKILSLGIDLLKPPQLSPDKRYLAWMYDGPMVLDTLTGDITTFGPDSRAIYSNFGGFVRWHPTAGWFFAYDDGMQAGGGRGPYYLSVVSANGQVHRELYADGVVNWLPPSVNPSALSLAHDLPNPAYFLKGSSEIVEWITWSNNEQWIMTNTGVWDVEQEKRVEGDVDPALFSGPPVAVPNWEGVQRIVVSPDGRLAVANFLSSVGSPYLAVYDTATREIIFTFPNWIASLSAASFTGDGRYVAISGPSVYWPVTIWDTLTWQIISIMAHPSLAVAFSPDGEYLAVGVSWDVEIWRVSDLIGQGDEPE